MAMLIVMEIDTYDYEVFVAFGHKLLKKDKKRMLLREEKKIKTKKESL